MRFNKIYVEITNKCNLNCSFCSKDNRELKELSLQEFDTILKKIKNYTNCIYLHVKGEPLLHRKFDKILDIAKNNNIDIKITTNGTLLKKQSNILQNSTNIRQINISLHSENKIKDYFKMIFETSDLLSKNIPIVYRIWLLNNFELDTLSTEIVDKIIDYYQLDKDFKELVIKNKNIKIKENIYLDKDNEFVWPDKKEEGKNKKGTCLGTRSHIAILVNGDVVPCCLDSKANLKLGNIFSNSMEEILDNPLFKEIHDGFLHHQLVSSMCQNCSFRENKFKSL